MSEFYTIAFVIKSCKEIKKGIFGANSDSKIVINKVSIEKKIIRILLYDIFLMIIHKRVDYCDSKWGTHSDTKLLIKDTWTKL